MAKHHTGCIGGFAAQNSGNIDDCFSIVHITANKGTRGGLTGENIGSITHSFYSGNIRRLHGGISGLGKGKEEQCYFFHDDKPTWTRKLRDYQIGRHYKYVKNEKVAESLGFGIGNIMEYMGGRHILRFIPEKWLFDTSELPKAQSVPIVINSAEQLIKIAKKINEGDADLMSAYIRLNKDLNLKGKEWMPIGNDLTKAFTGLFDGCGHTIKNFVIRSKGTKAKGFFGYLKGEVYNLTVDCLITEKNGATSGGLAAYCENGVIGNCAAIVGIKYYDGKVGGLVGSNTGRIFESYSAGKIFAAVFPWWWGLPLLPLLMLLLLLNPPAAEEVIKIFPAPPIDPGVERIPGEKISPRTGSNFVAFEFEREVYVDSVTGSCRLHFVNPGNSNHDIIVQLQMTDAMAIEAMGSTGRLPEEQGRLNAYPQYDPENNRVVLSESGAIPVGYRLDNLILDAQPNGASLPPGRYPAIVFLIFYDRNTHDRAMLESQLPVILNVN